MAEKDFGKPWYDTYISYLYNPVIDTLKAAKTEIQFEKALVLANEAQEKFESLLDKHLYPAASSYAEPWKEVIVGSLLEVNTLIKDLQSKLCSNVA
jgi:hypothetical protein